MNLCHLRGRTSRVWTRSVSDAITSHRAHPIASVDATAFSLEHVLAVPSRHPNHRRTAHDPTAPGQMPIA